ncbi:MAG: glycosyltransferase family 4 protein [Elainellaceae cyanobacterium]
MLTPQRLDDLRQTLDVSGLLIMYVGNLEPYQGIDLLLDSFALVLRESVNVDLVIIGGKSSDIQAYRNKSKSLGIGASVHWLGAKPVEQLQDYLSQADILVSSRIKGINTPMKLYSYLGSGKATLVTDLPTHTQLVDQTVAMLALPNPKDFAQAMLSLISDAALREQLGKAGKTLIEENFSHAAFTNRLNSLLDWLESEVVDIPTANLIKPPVSNS